MRTKTLWNLVLLLPLSGCFMELSTENVGPGVLALEVADVQVNGQTARVADLENGIVTDTGGYIITGFGCPDLLAEFRLEGGGDGDVEPFDLSMALNIHGFSRVDQFAEVHGMTLSHDVPGTELLYGPHEATDHTAPTASDDPTEMGFAEEESLLDPEHAIPTYSLYRGLSLNFDAVQYGSRPLLSSGYYGPSGDPSPDATRAVLARFDPGATEGAERVTFRAINGAGQEVNGSFELIPVDTDDIHYVNGRAVGVYSDSVSGGSVSGSSGYSF